MSYKILLRKHPFVQSSYEVIEKTKSEPIERLLKEFDISHRRYVFAINGVISDDLKYKPKNGDLITIKVLPEGGPDEARSAGEKTAGWGGILVVVGFITSFFFAPVGLAIMGAGLIVGFVGAGIMGIADMWDKLSKSANLTMAKNLPQIAGSRNSTNPWGKIPVVLGTHKISPYYASKPYTTISGTDGDTQYLYELFAIGYKTLSVSDIKIGETLLASNSADIRNGTITIDGSYADVTLEIRQDGTLPANWSNTILEDSISVQAKYGKETWRTTPDKTTKAVVEIYLPRGLFKYKDDGGTDNHSVTVEIKYRAAGSTTSWESCSNIGTLNITRNTTTAMRFRFEKTLTAGKYEIGVKRTSADDTADSKKMSDTYWSIMQSWTASAPVSTLMLGKVCLLAVKIKATDQLNGIIDNLNLIAKSVVRVGPNWNTSTISNNPADLFVHVATQAANARAIPDNKIDWSVINAWRTTCLNKGWTCNAVITNGEKLKSILNRIAQTGRASLNLRDGLYSVVVDEPKATIVQHFTNKNVKNFSWTKSFAKTPHGLRVNFLSASDGYASSERKVFDDGYSEANATEYLQLDMWGITDPDLAWKHGRYRIACMKLRPEIYTFETDPEGIICEPGDLVLVSHDAISVGQKSGRIKNLIISGSDITGFELDEIVTMETGKNYGIKIRKNDGTFVSYQITTSAGDKTTVSLTSAIPVSGGPQVDNLYTFGEYGTETLRCIVIGYEPTSDYGIKLYLTDEAPGVHIADSGTIPDYEPLITRQAEEITLDKISGEIARIDGDLSGLSGTINGTPSKRIIVNLYQELTTTPDLPTADITVDLLNNTYTNLTNNWSPTQPQAVRKPVWMINYSTIIPVTQNEITITAASWPQPIKIFIGTPMYLGMTASVPDENSFPNKIEGDWCFCSADGKFYKLTGSAWAIDIVTTNEKMAALQDMLTIADSSGATAFVQTLASVNAFIDMLAANEILVSKIVTNTAFAQTLEAINVKIQGTLRSGAAAATDAKVALQDSIGVAEKTFTGTGNNDLQVTQEGITAGNADVQIASAQVNDTTHSGGKIIVAGSTNTEAAPSSTADTDWQTAVNNASGASYNGVTGWTMPTRTELQTMRTVLGLSSGLYWSGESVDADNAYVVDMSDGSVWTKQKIQTITRTLPTNRYRRTSQLYNGKIYIPQYDGTTMEIFDIATSTTTTVTLPTNMSRITSQLYNGKIYMPQNNGTTMEIYDIATSTTTTVTLPTNMSRITSQLYNGKIYMPQSNGTTMEIYDIATGTTTTKTLPTNAQRATSLLYNGNIYMPLNNSTKMEIFDIATGTTTTITLPTNMYRWTSQLYNGKIYMPQDGGTTMEIYDIATSTTTTVTLPTNMSRITSQLYNGKIYMPQNVGTTMEIFDIATSTTTTKTLQTNMYRMTSKLYNGKIYMPQNNGTTMEIFSIPIPTRYVRNNTETRRCQVRVNGGSWTDKGVIVKDTDIDVGLDIKVRFPSLTNHVVGDNWHLVQDSMRGLSIKDKDGVEYLSASDGLVKLLDRGGFNYGTPGYKTVKTYTQSDAKPAMILLAPVYAGTLIAKNGFIGTVYRSRGSTSAFEISEKYDVICTTAYTEAKLVCTGSNPNVRIVQTTYDNTGYYALYFPPLSENRITLDGLFWGDPIEISDATGYPVTEVSYNLGPYSIVETGSNTNGNWIKFSDGTMIQRGKVTLSPTFVIRDSNIGTYGWSVYMVSYASGLYIYLPTSFYATDDYQFFALERGGRTVLPYAQNDTVDRVLFGVLSQLGETPITISWLAIGRWKQ